MKSRSWIVVGAALALSLAFPAIGRADDKDKDKAKTFIVHFGQPQPQTPDAVVGAAVTHFLDPDDITIHKGDKVVFVVNGGGHGIAIHPVSKDTTRAGIAAFLCDGNIPEQADRIADRKARATADCNATATVTRIVNNVSTKITNTSNDDYTIKDEKGNIIIHTGFNLTPATSDPDTTIDNPRVDDKEHTVQLLATSGQSRLCGPGETPPACDASAAKGKAGALLGGSAGTNPGNQIPVVFRKTGRYLVICMNRNHSLNDHMFGFVFVTDDDDDKDKDK
jgi:plastocyanin